MAELTPEERIARLRAQRGQAPVAPTAPTQSISQDSGTPLPPPASGSAVSGIAGSVDQPVPGVIEATPDPTSVSFMARLNDRLMNHTPRPHPARRARRATGVVAGVGFLAMLPLMGSLTASAQPDDEPDGEPHLLLQNFSSNLAGILKGLKICDIQDRCSKGKISYFFYLSAMKGRT